MDSAVMEPVLKELLHQQQEMLAEREKESESRQELFVKLEAIEKKVDVVKPPIADNGSTILIPLLKKIEEVKALVEAQPKTVVNKKSFQLFPSLSEAHYKFIFGNLFKGLVLLILCIYTLVIINRYIREQEYLHYKQAWQYLYSIQNEEEKQFLEKIMKVSENEDFSKGADLDSQTRKAILKSTPKPAKK